MTTLFSRLRRLLKTRTASLRYRDWSSASPIRGIFEEAFQNSGLPYLHPHSFRRTLAQLGEQRCKSPEEFKAWSQNLGHEKVLTTYLNYGAVTRNRQAEILRKLAQPDDVPETNSKAFAIRCRDPR
jgi:integrase/recombinase XerD